MDILTKKEKSIAKTAEKSTPKKDEKPRLKLPSRTELMKNPMKYISVAVEQFQKMDERVTNIEDAVMNMAKGIDARDKSLAPLVELAERAKQMREAQPQGQGSPQAGGGGMGLIQMLAPFLRGGGGGGESWIDEEMKTLFKNTLKTNIERGRRETNILENVGVAVISKITGKTVSDVVKDLTSA